MGWFEQAALNDVTDTEDDKTTEKNDGAAKRSRFKASSKAVWATAVGVVGVFAVGGVAAWQLMGSADSSTEAVAAPPAPETTAQSETTTAKAPEGTGTVGPACAAGEELGDAVEGPAGAWTKFQQAYFARDAEGVRATLSADSPMAKTDWGQIFADQKPDETTWCVTVEAVDAETVLSTTTGEDAGEEFQWKQKITTNKEDDGTWRVDSVEDRK